MAGYSGTTSGANVGGGYGGNRAVVNGSKKVLERIHSLSYSATVNKLLLDVELAATEGSVKTDTVGEINIKNTGGTPAFAILAYRLWTDATTMSATTYHLNYLLKPGESMVVPDSPAVIADDGIEQLAGTAVTNEAPNSNEYTASGCLLAEAQAADEPDIDVDDGDYFRVGDLIRIEDEIMEVLSISTDTLSVKKGLYGSSSTSHNDNDPIRFPFFNAYHDFDKYSVAQTDSNGKFKCQNFFGKGRATTHLQGLTPGSIAFKFYEPGYQELGLSGITSSTNSGLTASTAYEFDIQVDGGTNFDNLSFTTDSSNVNFGGTNGVITKIQEALDVQFYTSGNLFEKKVTVGIVNGDLRFTSGTRLSTSAIALTAGSTGTAEFFGTGRIPAIGSIRAAVDARLSDDVKYNPIDYSSLPNTSAFGYDDGYGNLFGKCTGKINYETGAVDFVGPPNAEFVISCLHTSAFSGKQHATDTAKMNTVKAIYGNVPNQKWSGELTIERK